MHQGKTGCVLFGTDSRLVSAKFSVTINDSDIGNGSLNIHKYKYLGVILDECTSLISER